MKNNLKNNLYLFDCFGVVVSDVSTLWMNLHFNDEQKDYIRREIFRKVDTAQMTFDYSMKLLSSMCGLEEQAMRAQWDSQMYLMPDTVELIRKIRANGGTVALLSNASQDYIDKLFSQYNLFALFDKLFISANFRCAKPDLEFYQACLDAFPRKFDKVFFTDDNPANLAPAQKLGIQTHLFTSAADLAKQLSI